MSNALDYQRFTIEVYRYLRTFFKDRIEVINTTMRNPTKKEIQKHGKLVAKQRKRLYESNN